MPYPRVICLAGPTGTGKSAAAIALAKEINGVIINADSRQVYRDFPIITAQPGPADKACCPHLLYGFLDSDEPCTAGLWAQKAKDAIETILASGATPIFVGGTGMYMRALFDGIVDIPPVPASIFSQLEKRFHEEGGEILHRELAAADPDYACRIHPNDRQRVIRALGVMQGTGHTFSWWHAHTPPPAPYEVIRLAIGLPLSELTPLLAARIDQMLEAGAMAEAQKAKQRCDRSDAPGWSGIGCAELYRCLAGELTLAQARDLWIKNTRAYAKRQLTWFKADPRLTWFRPNEKAGLLREAKIRLTKTG